MTLEMHDTIRQWIRYEDGVYEPVRLRENLMNKRRGPGIPDWWVVDMPRDWTPLAGGYPCEDNHPSGPLTARRDSTRHSELLLSKDEEGRIAKRVLKVQGLPREYDYTYDEKGCLAEVHCNGTLREWYRYDAKGRRYVDVLAQNDNKERRYVYSQDNRLIAAGNTRFEHDEYGFRSVKHDAAGRTEYRYAPNYRLLAARLPDGTIIEYDHEDEDDMPVAKYVNGQLYEEYEWYDMVRLAAFHDCNTGFSFLYHDDERLPYAMSGNKELFFLNYDQVGSLISVADSNGAMIKYIEYDSFGNILRETNPELRIPIGFAGGLHDPHTGLVRFGWRDYDPDTGRWTAKDPIGPAGGDPDYYGYCLDDPINGKDPLGLFFFGGLGVAGLTALAPVVMRAAPLAIRAARRYGPQAMKAAKTHGRTMLNWGKEAATKAGQYYDKVQKGAETMARQANQQTVQVADKMTKAGDRAKHLARTSEARIQSSRYPFLGSQGKQVIKDHINPGLPPESIPVLAGETAKRIAEEGEKIYDNWQAKDKQEKQIEPYPLNGPFFRGR